MARRVIELKLTSNAKEVRRKLKRIRRHRVFLAEKKTMDAGAKLAKEAFVKEWRRAFDVKKPTFPGTVLRIRKSHVSFNTGVLNRPARLINVGAGKVLLLQMQGGTRKPRGRALLVPVASKRKPRNPTFRRGKAIVISMPRSERLYAVLARQVRIPRRFSLSRVERRVERAMLRVGERILRRELARSV